MISPLTALEFCSIFHDVIIVGGGTAGLTLAARLSEDPSLKVGVIEAGFAQFDNDLVNIPGLLGRAAGTDIDWNFNSIPIEGLNGRVLHHIRGKMLGGSSGINYMLWNRADRNDYDEWEELGNPGWNWDTIFSNSFKAERFQPPIYQTQLDILPTPQYNPSYHNKHGSVYNSFPKWSAEPVKSFIPTLGALGVPQNKDSMGGDNRGIYVSLQSVEQHNATRSYSATAYLRPVLDRKNLAVVTGSQATKILLKNNKASGVQFVANGTSYEVKAKKEVVLSAGSYSNPHLLELSGIGNSSKLAEIGIDTIVKSPGVGENLQDHLTGGNVYELIPGIVTSDLFSNATLFAQFQAEYAANHTGPLSAGFGVFAMLPLSFFLSPNETATLVELAQSTYPSSPYAPLLRRDIANDSIPHVELLFAPTHIGPGGEPGKTYLTILAALLHPFSVGSVHTNSTNPLDYPIISPHFYDYEIDRKVMVEAAKFIDKIANTEPLKHYIQTRISPPASEQPLTDEQWRANMILSASTTYHPVGTCAMLPKKNRGVVDTHLRVYGVKGLRVVDASIFPKQIATHPQLTVYAIAENAATIMKNDLAKDA